MPSGNHATLNKAARRSIMQPKQFFGSDEAGQVHRDVRRSELAVMHLGAAHGLLDQALRDHGEFDVSD